MNQENIRVVKGQEVLNLLEEPAFIERLTNLFEESIGTTVFQNPVFIKSWYQTKVSEYLPLVAIDQDGFRLNAAVFLAVKKESNGKIKSHHAKIVGVGEYDAEYQTWLVKEGDDERFLTKAFSLILKDYPNSKLIFRFVPSYNSLSWIYRNSKWKKVSVIQEYHRPLLQMSHPKFKDVMKKRHLKAKYNRFRRAGKMDFEEIIEVNRFIEVYDEVMDLYDFRQGALFNKIPSQSNELRRPLFVSLFKQNILHVSVLKLDDVITSCIIGMKSKFWMHLSGLITYSPFYSKHSPGLVHLFILSKYLEEQGFEYFDLSPGGDGYKERMASNADEVYELTISQDPLFKAKIDIRKKFHAFLLSRGVRSMDFNLKVKRSKHLIKLKVKEFKNSIVPKKVKQLEESKVPIEMVTNNIKHLLMYDDYLGTSRWDFLSNAFKKVEAGEKFISWADDSKLLFCIWFHENVDNSVDNKTVLVINEDYYNHPVVAAHKEELLKTATAILNSLNG
ncbi:GNAT family N-acetyltransferase [Cyclobacterium sp. 1_MG-2023]|uniref:GNAT family N-acetyltransferase n=1 Tax=Cyclobacterium sp. 1_MG-2023 TaxID=3062681 RepID=UPI0026E2BBA7|nr:GNAT family N-acetyltransferase [Cyclobacterium sp. 1_MG-2023]MDO6440363.1 GNAT family N-acetyltransferase [Cyclobacterium sp. 1_MG-2023]